MIMINPIIFWKHLDLDLIDNQIATLGKTLQSSSPDYCQADRSKIQGIFTELPFLPTDKITLLVQTVVDSVKNKSSAKRQTVYYDLARSKILSVDVLEKCSETFSSCELLQLKVEIAKHDMEKNPEITSKNIRHYGIDENTSDGQLALIEIARLGAMQRDCGIISLYIQNYGIKDQTALIEIATLVAQNARWGSSRYFPNYGFKEQTTLINIAKIAAQQDEEISQYIQNYQIDANTPEGQTALIEIAKLAAQQNGEETSKYIQKYKINAKSPQGQAGLFEIAKLAVQQNSLGGALKNLSNYPLEADKAGKIHKISYLLLLQALLLKDGFEREEREELIRWIFESLSDGLYDCKLILKMISEMTNKDTNKNTNMNIGEFCEANWSEVSQAESNGASKLKKKNSVFSISTRVLSLMDQIASIKQKKMTLEELEGVKTNAIVWLIITLGMLSIQKISAESMSTILFIVEAALKLKDFQLRELMTNQLVFNFVNSDHKQFESNLWKFQSLNHKLGILPCFMFTLLGQQEVEIYPHLQLLQTLKSKGAPVLKDVNFLKQLLKFLDVLCKEMVLDSSDKKKLLDLTFGTKKFTLPLEEKEKIKVEETKLETQSEKIRILSVMGIIKSIIDLGHAEKMRGDILTQWDLESIFLEAFLKEVPIRKGIDNLAIKLKSIFKGFQNPYFIFIYAACLKKGSEYETLGSLAKFLEFAINNEFPSCRYRNSNHLKTIFEQRSNLQDSWEKGDKKDLGQFMEIFLPTYKNSEDISKKNLYQNWKIVDTDDFVDLFTCGTEIEGSCQNIHGDSRFNRCLMAYVLDGKNRLLMIKDEKGKMQARAILRLLIDSKTNQPVLFLERIYPKIHSREIEIAFIMMAKSRSQALEIPLLSKEVGQGIVYDWRIKSLSSIAPFEYVDANGKEAEETFSIKNTYIIE
jgi:hypothetical protein